MRRRDPKHFAHHLAGFGRFQVDEEGGGLEIRVLGAEDAVACPSVRTSGSGSARRPTPARDYFRLPQVAHGVGKRHEGAVADDGGHGVAIHADATAIAPGGEPFAAGGHVAGSGAFVNRSRPDPSTRIRTTSGSSAAMPLVTPLSARVRANSPAGGGPTSGAPRPSPVWWAVGMTTRNLGPLPCRSQGGSTLVSSTKRRMTSAAPSRRIHNCTRYGSVTRAAWPFPSHLRSPWSSTRTSRRRSERWHLTRTDSGKFFRRAIERSLPMRSQGEGATTMPDAAYGDWAPRHREPTLLFIAFTSPCQ